MTFFWSGCVVSTGRAFESQVEKARDAFETRDFYLACFLRYSGYELLDLRADGRRKIFVFKDRQSRRQDVIAFYGDAAVAAPLAYSTVIKDMKALLHNG